MSEGRQLGCAAVVGDVAVERAAVEFAAVGSASGDRGAVLGSTTVNTQGWAAASVTISNPGLVGGATRGLYAVSWDVSARSSLLVPARQDLNEASESSSATALGWAPGAVLLFGLSATDEAGQILGWNVIDGSIYRVARLIAPPGSYWGPLPSLSP